MCLVQVNSDRQLMIHFLMHVFKQSQHHSIYWANEDARAEEWAIGKLVAYYHMIRDNSYIADDIVR